MPRLSLHNRCPNRELRMPRWRSVATKALPHCLAALRDITAPLAHLEEIEITFLSDEEIATVHGEFMDDPTATDVITFHHGEILISLDTAARQGESFSHPYEREVALYIIHGLLHLAGWDDRDPTERDLMHLQQNAILQVVWPS